MLPLPLAQELKAAGLVWRTSNYDFFAIPDRDMDDRVFVLADMMAYTELVRGWPVVAFHGTAEWALDYILTREVVWMPTEEQLRQELAGALERAGGPAEITLTCDGQTCRCRIRPDGEPLEFVAPGADEAYGLALLYLLRDWGKETTDTKE